jgi:hypothetical protein
MSSQESLHRQYFGRLFNQTTSPIDCGEYQGWNYYETKSFQFDGSNFVYEEDVMDAVATHYTDYPMGRDFFHSMYRMHKDALADGAKRALNKIFGPIANDEESDDNQEQQNKGKNSSDTDNSEIYLGLLALLFVPGVMIGVYVGMTHRQRQQTRAQKEIDISISSNSNVTTNNTLHNAEGGRGGERGGERGAMRVTVS